MHDAVDFTDGRCAQLPEAEVNHITGDGIGVHEIHSILPQGAAGYHRNFRLLIPDEQEAGGKMRKYYRITRDGKKQYQAKKKEWKK